MHRREFLILGSAAVAGLATTNVTAGAVSTPQPLPILSIGYLASRTAEGRRTFLAADRLSSGDARFEQTGARLRFEGFWTAPPRRHEAMSRAVNVLYNVDGQKHPFTAWSYAQTRNGVLTSAPVSVTVPLDGRLIELGIESRLPAQGAGPEAIIPAAEHSITRLSTSSWGRTPRLRRGIYAVALRSSELDRVPSWGAVQFAAEQGETGPLQMRTIAGVEPVPFDYVLISIDYA